MFTKFNKYLPGIGRICYSKSIKEQLLAGLPKQGNKNVIVKRARQQDTGSILTMMKEHYFEDEPVCAVLKLPKTNTVLDEYVLRSMDEGTTLIAEEDGFLLGSIVNCTSCPWDASRLEAFAEQKKCESTISLLRFLAMIQRVPKIYESFKEVKVWEMRMLTVVRESRGRGIGTMLANEALTLGRDLGYRIARMDCSNSHASRIAEENNMTCVHRYPYNCFRDRFGSPIFTRIGPTNTHMMVYVDNLRKMSKSDTRWLANVIPTTTPSKPEEDEQLLQHSQQPKADVKQADKGHIEEHLATK